MGFERMNVLLLGAGGIFARFSLDRNRESGLGDAALRQRPEYTPTGCAFPWRWGVDGTVRGSTAI